MTGPARTPSRDASARIGAFEIQVEAVWMRLRDKPLTVCLSMQTGLLATRAPRPDPYPGEIGTYTRRVELRDFRADCFFALEQGRGR